MPGPQTSEPADPTQPSEESSGEAVSGKESSTETDEKLEGDQAAFQTDTDAS